MGRRAHLTRTGGVLRAVLAAAMAVAGTVAVVVATPAPASAAPVVRWVDVSVATLWAHRERPVPRRAGGREPGRATSLGSEHVRLPEAMAVARPQPDPGLYGTRVRVDRHCGRWSKVVVPSQPSPKDQPRLPGLDFAQADQRPPHRGERHDSRGPRRTAWLWADHDAVGTPAGKVMELSYGTSLPVVSAGAAPGRRRGAGRRDPHPSARGGRPPVRRGPGPDRCRGRRRGDALPRPALPLVGHERLRLRLLGPDLVGVPAAGVTIPRDAAPQATGGTAVTRRDLRPGDLVFLRTPAGVVHHVAMYVGRIGGVRTVVEAPHTGASVRLTPLTRWGPGYAGARRYLTP